MTEQTYRDHLTDLQLEVEELRAKLKASQAGDLISRQAAIDLIESIETERLKGNVGLIYAPAIKGLRALPSAQPEQRWIPCRERLPEKSGRYLVTRGLNAAGAIWNRVYIVNYSDLMGLKGNRIFWQGNVGKSDFEKLEDVLAWMPLPEPYTERRTNETQV